MSYRSQSDELASSIERLADIGGSEEVLQQLAHGELSWIRMLSSIGERQIQLLERLLSDPSLKCPVPESSHLGSLSTCEDEIPARDVDLVNELLARAEKAEQELSLARDENERLEQRLQLALDELHQARRGESEKGTAGTLDGAMNSAMDWETQKQQLLSRWDAEGTTSSQWGETQRIIAETDEIVRRKDEEIQELQRLLQQQSENIGGIAIGAVAIEGLLETDELIRQERERLEALQSQWREKFRQAEIDTSMERAKLARERRELESRFEELKRDQARWAEEREVLQAELSSQRPANVPKNRWFNRLGLRDGNDR